jgi:hypothetical protein
MSRELVAHHDPTTMTPDFASALAVHRAYPGLSVVELCQRAKLPGGVRKAIEHALDCPTCLLGALCPTGARLAAKIRRPRRRRAA